MCEIKLPSRCEVKASLIKCDCLFLLLLTIDSPNVVLVSLAGVSCVTESGQ